LAQKAAEAALCAGRQDKIWEMHDLLFQNQRNLESSAIANFAQKLRLDQAQFDACLAGEAAAQIRTDLASAESVEMKATPGFLFGTIQQDGQVRVTKRFSGARPLASFVEVLDSLVKGREGPH
jgi:protein-disulfide isomerase